MPQAHSPTDLVEKGGTVMSNEQYQPGELPTEPITQEQRVVLVESLQVTWKVLEHLKAKGMLKPQEDGRVALRAGCCTPSGGTCCVNKKVE
jgi:hypothetical protein